MLKSVIRTIAVTPAAAVLLVSCGGGGSATSADAASAQVKVHALDSLKFDQATYAAHAGDVTFGYFNDGAQQHTLLVEGKSGFKLKVNNHGDSAGGSLNLPEGTYTLYCDVPTHRESGMEAKVNIGPPVPSSGAPGSSSAAPTN
jgi:plastocyanin